MAGKKIHKHPNKIFGDTAKDFAQKIVDLRFDAMADLLGYLADHIMRMSVRDKAKGRDNLAIITQQLSISLKEAADLADKCWDISEPFTVTDEDIDLSSEEG